MRLRSEHSTQATHHLGHGFFVFALGITIEHNAGTCLCICYTILYDERTDNTLAVKKQGLNNYRIAMHQSIDLLKEAYPTAPPYAPLLSGSISEMSSIARTFGAPERVPAGKI